MWKCYIRLSNCCLNVCREEEVLASTCRDHFLKPRFVDGEAGRVPGCDSLCRLVHNSDSDVRTLLGDNAAGWPPDIASTKTTDFANAPAVHFNQKLNRNAYFQFDRTQINEPPFISSKFCTAGLRHLNNLILILINCNTTPVFSIVQGLWEFQSESSCLFLQKYPSKGFLKPMGGSPDVVHLIK